jgi:osmotically-inducible protein OsmY
MPDDMTLQAMVMDELAWTPNVDAAHIGVAAQNGVVTLSGIVSSLAEKVAAEQVARRVKGVQGIAQKIVVRLPTAHRQTDEEIADRALKVLNWDLEVPDEQIQVKVENGIVTLTGTVTYQFQRAAADRDIRRLGGVTDIVNLIEIRPSADQVVDPVSVHHKIENALRRSAEMESSHVSVEVSGSKVTLRGRVKTWWERSLAESAAWSAPGVTQVDDQLTFGS